MSLSMNYNEVSSDLDLKIWSQGLKPIVLTMIVNNNIIFLRKVQQRNNILERDISSSSDLLTR